MVLIGDKQQDRAMKDSIRLRYKLFKKKKMNLLIIPPVFWQSGKLQSAKIPRLIRQILSFPKNVYLHNNQRDKPVYNVFY